MRWLAHKLINSAERQTGEPADFMRDMLNTSPAAFWKFAMFTPMARHRQRVPATALHAARIAATHAEDCGPCLQTVVNYAARDGMSPRLIKAAVEGDTGAMDPETRLAFEFSRCLAARDPHAEDLRDQVEAVWGKEGIVDLALATTATRVFPILKRAMGYAEACQRVTIERETVAARLPTAAALASKA